MQTSAKKCPCFYTERILLSLVLHKDQEASANLGRVKNLQGAIEVWLDETFAHAQTPSCELSKATLHCLQVRSILAPPQLIRLPVVLQVHSTSFPHKVYAQNPSVSTFFVDGRPYINKSE
jgi:hypothetical protein